MTKGKEETNEIKNKNTHTQIKYINQIQNIFEKHQNM